MTPDKYKPVARYIKNYWQKCSFQTGKVPWSGLRNMLMRPGKIDLPFVSVAPNHRYFSGVQYYWDSYFTVIGLLAQDEQKLAKGMVDNLCLLFPKFGLIPARNTWLSVGRTQPPFLTRMAFEVYEAGGASQKWLHAVLQIAEKEYTRVWTSGQRLHKSSGLSLYQPKRFRHWLTTYESGWDVSTRFAHGKTNILPVDLNCLLYQYEADFARAAVMKQDEYECRFWKEKMSARRTQLNKYFWDKKTGYYFDYELLNNSLGNLKTLAGFYPLWCGAADKAQAYQLKNHLAVFEHPGGLATTEKLPWRGRQWDYPNGWGPLQLLTIEGLRRYGFGKEANRLTHKWLELNLKLFEQTGELWEKYDVVNGQIGLPGRYPTQAGFAWTNGVFIRLVEGLKQN